MDKVKAVHIIMLESKRAELLDTVDEFVNDIAQVASGNEALVKTILEDSNFFFDRKRSEITREQVISMLDGKMQNLIQKYNSVCEAIKFKIEEANKPKVEPKTKEQKPVDTTAPKKYVKSINKFVVFNNAKLETDEDIEQYLNDIRNKIKKLKQTCDILELK